jgi:hypothetical protein
MAKKVLTFPSPSRAAQELDAQLRQAIATKHLIQFDYEGAVRVAEPHDYGRIEGVDKVLAYQRRKAGRGGKFVMGWRSLFVSKIENCVVLDDTFPGTRGDAHKQHYKWDVLYARVDGSKTE